MYVLRGGDPTAVALTVMTGGVFYDSSAYSLVRTWMYTITVTAKRLPKLIAK